MSKRAGRLDWIELLRSQLLVSPSVARIPSSFRFLFIHTISPVRATHKTFPPRYSHSLAARPTTAPAALRRYRATSLPLLPCCLPSSIVSFAGARCSIASASSATSRTPTGIPFRCKCRRRRRRRPFHRRRAPLLLLLLLLLLLRRRRRRRDETAATIHRE